MALNRREFMYRIADRSVKALKAGAVLYGISQIPTSELLKMLGTDDITRATMRLMDFNLAGDAEAASLPLNYVSQAFSVPAGGDVSSGIALLTTNSGSGGTGTSSAIDNTDTSLIKNGGTKNIQLDLNAITATRQHEAWWTLTNLVMDQRPTIGFRMYFSHGFTSNMLWDLANDAADNDSFRMNLTASPLAANLSEWQWFNWFRDESALSGSGNWQTDFIRSRFICSTLVGQTDKAYFDQQYSGGYQHPVVPWIFEGGDATHYSVAFAEFTARAMQGTIAIPTSSIGTGGFLTIANIDEMYAAGWDVMHMSDTTAALTGLSVQQVTDRLGTAEAYMNTRGWTRTLKHMALPGSAGTAHRTDANVLTALGNLGYLSALDKWSDGAAAATAISTVGIDPLYGISLNPYRVPAWRTENPNTLTHYQNHVNHAIKAGGFRILRTGPIAGAATPNQMDAADFTTMMRGTAGTSWKGLALWHHAGTIDCVPWRKAYAGLSGRRVR